MTPRVMPRALAALAILLVCGGAGPIGATLLGTLRAPLVRNTAGACVLNGAPNAAGTDVDALGPAAATYRRTAEAGPVTVLLPALGHAVPGARPLMDYAAIGAARLDFTTVTSGRVTFLPGGLIRNPNLKPPTFSKYQDSWNAALKRLFVSFTLRLGPCGISVSGAFQG